MDPRIVELSDFPEWARVEASMIARPGGGSWDRWEVHVRSCQTCGAGVVAQSNGRDTPPGAWCVVGGALSVLWNGPCRYDRVDWSTAG